MTDAAIVFNSSYAWDFDPSDGIEDGTLDFVGVAAHEIGHALGFESGVDELDGNGFGSHSDDSFAFVGSIDFLRFSEDSENAGADIDWTADDRSKYFSIDGGLSVELAGNDHWSTGVAYGDGEQASHWAEGLGLLDPLIATGEAAVFSSADIQAFDVIGYNRSGFASVPEPSGMLIVLGAVGFLVRRRRSRSLV